MLAEAGPVEADVDRAPVAERGIVEEHRLGIGGAPARRPQERAVDDRELEALAAVDREDLHRLRIGLEPARPLLLALLSLRGGHLLREPATQRRHPELLGGRGLVQQLREVAHVGQPALAVGAREDARGEVLVDHDRLGQLGDAVLAEDPVPAVKPAVHVLPLVLAGRRDPLRAPADERRQRRDPGA